MKRNNKGFTLLEVLVVVLLLTVLSGIASLSMHFVRRARLSNAAAQLVADLQRARLHAMTRGGKGVGIRLESSQSYVIFGFKDCNDDYTYDTDTCAGKREEEILMEKKLPDSVVMTKTNPVKNVSNDVRIFDRFGGPRKASWGMGMITIVLKSQPDVGLIKCIVISGNRIREGFWGKSACIS